MSDDEPLDPLDEISPPDEGGEQVIVTETERRRRRSRIEEEERELREFWGAVFASPVGRRAMWALLEMGHRKDTRFACGPNGFPHPEATWFHAGEQALAQRQFSLFRKYAREGVMVMEDEHDPDFMAPRKRGRKVTNG